MPQIRPFLSLNPQHDTNRDPRVFRLRDAWSGTHVVKALEKIGFDLGEELINHPPPARQKEEPPQLAHVYTDDCEPDDLITTITRLPVSDEDQGGRKRVPRAYTDLEQELIEVWSHYLPILSREHVRLRPELRALLPAGYEGRYDILFYEKQGAPYRKLKAHSDRRHRPYRGNGPRTAAFLLRIPRLPHRRVGYFGMVGPDGITTLVTSRWLRFEQAELLREPGFVMVEFACGPIPERPTDNRWTSGWAAEILFRAPPAAQHSLDPDGSSGGGAQQRAA